MPRVGVRSADSGQSGVAIGVTVGVLAFIGAGIAAFVLLFGKKQESSSIGNETAMQTEAVTTTSRQWEDVEDVEHDFLNPMETGGHDSEGYDSAFGFTVNMNIE
jgi:hypothetical protein